MFVAVGGLLYVNQVVVPATPPLFIPTETPTQSPESFVNRAEELARAGKLPQAIDAYKDAISTDPTNPANYVALARLQVLTGQYDEAVINAQNAQLKNPNNGLAVAVEAWAMGFLEKFIEAERKIKQALELDPNSALAHAYYAEILIIQENADLIQKAIEESQKAQALDNRLFETHRIRGIILYNTTNHEEAIREFEAALAINKNIADVHLYLGLAYKALEEYDKAAEALLLAYALDPTNTVGLTELSRAYAAAGRFAPAVQYAEEAVKVEPSNPRLHGNLGIMYYENEELDQAIQALSLAVRGGTTAAGTEVKGLPLDYSRVMSYYWYYGFALTKRDRCTEAVPVFQALLTGVPNDETAVYNANAGLEMCAQKLGTPVALPTATEKP